MRRYGRIPGPTALDDLDDDALVQRTLDGNRAAFGVLVLRYQARVLALCAQITGDYDQAPDLSQEAFAKIADVSAGNVPITWTVVPSDVTDDLSYEYKDGTSQWWTAIQVRNSRRAVQGLEWMSNGAWTPIMRTDYDQPVATQHSVAPAPAAPLPRTGGVFRRFLDGFR